MNFNTITYYYSEKLNVIILNSFLIAAGTNIKYTYHLAHVPTA